MFRVLCLHDANSDAATMKDRFTMLGERLYEKHLIDLVYVNGPLDVSSSQNNNNNNNNATTRTNNPRRVWWELRDSPPLSSKENEDVNDNQDGEEPDDPTTSNRVYHLGLDASLMMLQQIWTSMPFCGILAEGQGATVASILCLLPELKPKPKFAIFLNGDAMLPEKERLVDEHVLACLHIINSQAGSSSSSGRLVEQFGGEVHTNNDNNSTNQSSSQGPIILTNNNMNIIGKFLVDQKKRMKRKSHAKVLALQDQLHLVEQRASQLIAEKILENPPAALQAVIAPKELGAWSGAKRREPHQDGGGAPCPSEFVLRPNQRGGEDKNNKNKIFTNETSFAESTTSTTENDNDVN